MKIKRFWVCVICVCIVCNFYIFTKSPTKAENINYPNLNISSEIVSNVSVDYLFTTSEVNASKITDTSISITSENFEKGFLDNAQSFRSAYGYDVNYDEGILTVSGLIPDFVYDSLVVEAISKNEEKYILQIKDFKTAKSQYEIRQFITTTLQYTLKKAICPIDFYMWEHKILMKEVTPEEFILRVLQDPQILCSVDKEEGFIERIYSAIFLTSIDEEELKEWVEKVKKYKQEYFVEDEVAYTLIAEEMMRSTDFKNRVEKLNIDEIEIPETTRYAEVYKKSIYDNKDYTEFELDEYLYFMDYDELNRTEVGVDYVVLFLNEGFTDKLYENVQVTSSIEGTTCKYENGKFIIEGLEPNTLYRNFIISYSPNGKETKSIFIQRIKTSRTDEQKDLRSNVINNDYNILKHFGVTIDEFLKTIYKQKCDVDLEENDILDAKILFVADNDGINKISSFISDSQMTDDISNLIMNLYNMVFRRFPEDDGFLYWIGKFEDYKTQTGDVNYSIRKIVEEITSSDEFETKFNNRIIQNISEMNNRNKKPDFKISFSSSNTLEN